MSYHQAVVFLLLSLLTVAPASAQNINDIRQARQEWRTIGWNNACSVALVHLAYPRLGDAIQSEPIMTRVGTLSIAPAEETATLRWALEADGALSWDARALAAAERSLREADYTRAGFRETIRPGPDADQPGLAATLHSTSTLAARARGGWPAPGWRWAGAEFNPLATCALLVYEDASRGSFYRFHLVRVYDARARIERARAHTTNARLLFDAGDVESAAAEAATGAGLAPELAVTRYHHAAMLAMTGHPNQAMAELAAAVRIDPKYKERARGDRDFDDLAKREDFRLLME
ncbi:MAG TPA: hypothetical protein DCZ01_12860 [Elusimicrobia bacterium]|nr:MAG: hypothetical protein A2X37_09175 [Elusimicrobia bacterium GWA2_66_18]HAZ09377.1 hypothetical protein [Elusimicrobiota bacterium]